MSRPDHERGTEDGSAEPPSPAEPPGPAAETPPPVIERPRPFEELGDFTTVDRRTAYLVVAAVAVGVAAAIVAAALLDLIGFLTNLFYYGRLSWSFASPAGNRLGVLALAVPVFGGLVIGLMARFGSERIRGHGIPEALESILVNKSRIEPKVTVLKPLSAALSIGTGGPFGAEGPIIMTGGSLGSVFGQTLHLSTAERKTLLVAGAAGGMAATFNTPFAAVLIAVELLLFEWRPRSLIPVGAASVTAVVVRWSILGSGPLFPVSTSVTPSAPLVGAAIVVGVTVALLATLLTWAVYAFEDLYRRLPVHWMWWPALGGLAIGVGGLVDPRVLGVGYGTIDLLLVGGLGLAATAVLLIVKGVVWSASLGSGTSGGVLAPLLMMGAASGLLLGRVLPVGSPALWALVALGAILGGTMRVPFTGAVFALELTHDISVLLPLLVAAVSAEAITVFTLKRSILTEKIARRRIHVAREYAVDPAEVIPIREVMHRAIVPVSADRPVGEAVHLAPEHAGKYLGLATIDPSSGTPVGLLTREDLVSYLAEGKDPSRPLRDLLPGRQVVLDPDQPIRVGAAALAEYDLESAPVGDRDHPGTFLGVFSRESLFEGRVLALQDEQERGRVLRVSLPRLRASGGPLGFPAVPTRPARARPAETPTTATPSSPDPEAGEPPGTVRKED